jgi:hypothetical protein
MFGRESISIILRNLSSIQPALRDVNHNSGRNPHPKNSIKNYMSAKNCAAFVMERFWIGALALVRGMASLCQCELGKDQRRNGSRKKPAPSPLQRALKPE